MAFLSDNVLDDGLQYLTDNAANLYICTQEPTTYAQANSTFAIGNKDGITVGSPQDGDSNGRKVVVSAIGDGSVTGTDTATHWAITDGVSELLAAEELSASQAVTSGNVFTLGAIDITIPDPA